MASGQKEPEILRTGLNIYMGGMGFQELIILVFVAMGVRFQKKLARQERHSFDAGQGVSMSDFHSPRQARKLVYVVYAVLGLITLRIISRLVEYSSGFDSYLATHEWFPYVFDAVPMLAALIALNALHPGRILRGPNSDFTEQRRADKEKKREKKEAKKVEKERKKERKKAEKKEAKDQKEARQEKKETKRGVNVTVSGIAEV